MKNEPLPAAVQEQIDRFYRGYPPKEAEQFAENYTKMVLSDKYRSHNLGRTESHQVQRKNKPKR